jgi:hypothetical protein
MRYERSTAYMAKRKPKEYLPCDRCGKKEIKYVGHGIPMGQMWCLTCCDEEAIDLGELPKRHEPQEEIRRGYLAEIKGKNWRNFQEFIREREKSR